MYEKALVEVKGDKEAWKAQCLARQLYIWHTTKQIYKAVHKAHDMLEKAKTLYREVTPKMTCLHGKFGDRKKEKKGKDQDHVVICH